MFKSSIKYKLLTFDELVINLDRLSRFKLPEDSFNRVFTSVLQKCLIQPTYSKAEIENLDAKYISDLVKEIWNKSVKNCCNTETNNINCNKALKLIIEHAFKNIDKRTKTLINTKLNISPILKMLSYKDAVFNLQFLMKVNEIFNQDSEFNIESLIELRNKFNLKYPISKILIVEGITEEILLPVFADKLNSNFDKNGIYILGAGGKSKSPALYLKLKNRVNIPIILLFDADAFEICNNLKETLIRKDKYILIPYGEFEDILSLNLIKRSLNNEYEPATPIIKDDLHIYNKMCENIENFYRTRHLGEFKKAKLSKILAQNVKYKTDITKEIKNLIHNII